MANAGDIYQVQLQITHGGGQVAYTRWYWEVEDDEPLITAIAVASRVEGFLGSNYSSQLNENNDFTRIVVINGSNNADFADYDPGIPGTATGTNLPAALGFYIRSFNRGPGYTRSDHLIMIGSTSSLTNQGQWSGSAVTAYGWLETLFGTALSQDGTNLIPVQLAAPFKLGVVPTIRQSLVGQWEYDAHPHWLRTRQDEAYFGLAP